MEDILKKELYNLEICLLKKFAEILCMKNFSDLNGIELADNIYDILVSTTTSEKIKDISLRLKRILVTYGEKLNKTEKAFEKTLISIKENFKKSENSILKQYNDAIYDFLCNPINYINYNL